jgi:Ca-activated chloride channel family protein
MNLRQSKSVRPDSQVCVAGSRSGAAHVLIAAMLLTFLMTAAFSVDFAFMQLVRTELRTASDAAAKAGAEALARTQSDKAAKAAAVEYANLHRVGGRPFQLSPNDVILGRVTGQSNGSWTFTPDATPYNSVRVQAKVGNGGATPAMPLFFSQALGHGPFATSRQATAGQQDVEVCLCIDRSGSMMFDMSGTEWAYPSKNPLLFPSKHYPDTFWRNYCSPPHPTKSRWAAMRVAVDIFLTEAGQFLYPPRTSLVTWGTEMTLSYYPKTRFTEASTDVALPSHIGFDWPTNRQTIENVMAQKSEQPVAGGTNLSSGLDMATGVLTGAHGRSLSSKVIILLTDGQWNAGRDPELSARDAASAGITVHTISMLTGSQPTLSRVAQLTGGKYYATSNEDQLEAAFRELARSLPIVLTD